jgi:hypothetical protein
MCRNTPLDTLLTDIRQSFADLGLVLATVDHLQTRAQRLLPLILFEIKELQPKLTRLVALLEEGQEEGLR